MPQFTYRLATIEDLDVLIELRLAMQNEVSAHTGSSDSALRESLRAYFARSIPAGDFVAILAEHEGKVVASSGLIFRQYPPSAKNPNGREAYIMNMYTLPEYRGKGIATTLLKMLIDLVREKKLARIILHGLEK